LRQASTPTSWGVVAVVLIRAHKSGVYAFQKTGFFCPYLKVSAAVHGDGSRSSKTPFRAPL
jgi:hypothetical protein